MKLRARFVSALSMMAATLIGVTPVEATSISSEQCSGVFSTSVIDMSGTSVAGEVLSVEIRSMSAGRTIWYQLNHVLTGNSLLVCELSPVQMAENRVDNGADFNSRLLEGDDITISFVSSSTSLVQVLKQSLTSVQASNANNGVLSPLPNLVVNSFSQIPLTVRDSAENVQVNAPWDLWEEEINSESGGSEPTYRYLTGGKTNSTGSVQTAGLNDGLYQLQLFAGDNAFPMAKRTKISFTVVGGIANFSDERITNNIVSLDNGNARFRLVDENLQVFQESLLELFSAEINDEDFQWDTFSRRNDGFFVGTLPDGSNIPLQIIAGGETRYANTYFTIDVADGVSTFKKGNADVDSEALVVDRANVAVKAIDLAGNAAPFADIQIFSAETCLTEASIVSTNACDSATQYVYTTRNGIGSVKLDEGTYWIAMNPWRGSFGSARSLSKFVVSANAISSAQGFSNRVAAGDSSSFGGMETLIVSSRPANFKANVTLQSGVPITSGYAHSQPVCNGYCTWSEFTSSWGDLDSSGRLSLYLPAAPLGETKSYNITVEPSGRSASLAARIKFVATVDDAGLITSVVAPAYLPNNVGEVQAGFWTLRLPAPNVSGRVLMPTGNMTAPYSDLEVSMWDESDLQYANVEDIPWMYADSNARFGAFFSPGRYRILVNPPYDLGNVASKEYEIVVNSNGESCLYVASNGDTCPTPIEPGAFDLRLAMPNVSGTVTRSGVAIDTSSLQNDLNVELKKWNADYDNWQWQRWSQLSDSGTYSFNIEATGTYQISANPRFLPGYASGFEYLVVGEDANGLTFCKIPEPGLDTLSRATCGGNTVVPTRVTADIALQRTNLEINATVPSGFNGYVQAYVSKLYEMPGGYERQMDSSFLDLRQVGSTLVHQGFSSLDDNNGNPAKYQVNFDSYSNTAGNLPLTRQKVLVWAHNFDSDDEIEICLDENFTATPPGCAVGVIDSSTPMLVSLGYGNMSGAVETPTGDGAPYSWVEVQKWEQNSWSNGSYSWNWQDLSAGANRDGRFALNVEEPGFYKVSARQQWGGTLPFADSSTLVQVGANGNWCVHNVEIPSRGISATPTQASCVFGRDNLANDGVEGLTLRLADPKITGTLRLNNDEPAANASISVRKWNPLTNYYEYSEWTNTNSQGRFFINPSDGDYQLEFYPGWNNRLTQIGFEKNLCLGITEPSFRPSDHEDCAETQVLDERFLGPNIKGIVCPAGINAEICTSNGVRYSWIEVREKGNLSSNDPDMWTYGKGSSTDRQGNFALRLPQGSDSTPKLYSLRVYPNDAGEQGVGKRIIVSVGQNECKTGSSVTSLNPVQGGCLALRIGLLSPNINGTLTYDTTHDPAFEQKFMKNSWVSIFSVNYTSYVTGANTNSRGKFSAFLPNGTYFVDSYSNSSIATRPTLRMTIEVNGSIVTWKYRNESTMRSGPIAADFDFILPNVKINLSPQLLTSHIILIKDLEGVEQPRRFVSNGILSTGILTQEKTYSFSVVRNYQETLDGDCYEELTVTIPEGTSNFHEVDLTTCEPGS